MSHPGAMPPPPRASTSRLLLVSWVLVLASAGLGIYANWVGRDYRARFGSPPPCEYRGACTPEELRAGLAVQDGWLFAAVAVFLVALVLNVLGTPRHSNPRAPVTRPWLLAVLSAAVFAGVVGFCAPLFLVLAFSGQVPAMILLVMLGTLVGVALPCLPHLRSWRRPRRAKVVATAGTVASPLVLALAAVPAPGGDSVQEAGTALVLVLWFVVVVVVHRVVIRAGGGEAKAVS